MNEEIFIIQLTIHGIKELVECVILLWFGFFLIDFFDSVVFSACR